MDATEIAVTLGGVGLIALILWFFFGAGEANQDKDRSLAAPADHGHK